MTKFFKHSRRKPVSQRLLNMQRLQDYDKFLRTKMAEALKKASAGSNGTVSLTQENFTQIADTSAKEFASKVSFKSRKGDDAAKREKLAASFKNWAVTGKGDGTGDGSGGYVSPAEKANGVEKQTVVETIVKSAARRAKIDNSVRINVKNGDGIKTVEIAPQMQVKRNKATESMNGSGSLNENVKTTQSASSESPLPASSNNLITQNAMYAPNKPWWSDQNQEKESKNFAANSIRFISSSLNSLYADYAPQGIQDAVAIATGNIRSAFISEPVLNPRTDAQKNDPNHYLTKAERQSWEAATDVVEHVVQPKSIRRTATSAAQTLIGEGVARIPQLFSYLTPVFLVERGINYKRGKGFRSVVDQATDKTSAGIWWALSQGQPYEMYSDPHHFYTSNISAAKTDRERRMIENERDDMTMGKVLGVEIGILSGDPILNGISRLSVSSKIPATGFNLKTLPGPKVLNATDIKLLPQEAEGAKTLTLQQNINGVWEFNPLNSNVADDLETIRTSSNFLLNKASLSEIKLSPTADMPVYIKENFIEKVQRILSADTNSNLVDSRGLVRYGGNNNNSIDVRYVQNSTDLRRYLLERIENNRSPSPLEYYKGFLQRAHAIAVRGESGTNTYYSSLNKGKNAHAGNFRQQMDYEILSSTRIKEAKAVEEIAIKYNDPYRAYKENSVKLEYIDENELPINSGAEHVYPRSSALDQYFMQMQRTETEVVNLFHKSASKEKIIDAIATHYQYCINARPFSQVNNSLFMNSANMQLSLLNLQEVPHGLLDHAAHRMQPENFKRYFYDYVMSFQN